MYVTDDVELFFSYDLKFSKAKHLQPSMDMSFIERNVRPMNQADRNFKRGDSSDWNLSFILSNDPVTYNLGEDWFSSAMKELVSKSFLVQRFSICC